MATPWLSVVVPTMGRPELARTFDSIDHQAHAEGAEVLVVADTFGGQTADLERAHELAERRGWRYRWLEHDAGLHCVGQPQRQYGMEQARAPWVAFSADDNILTADAFANIWLTIASIPQPKPLLFKVRTWQAGVVWRYAGVVAHGNIDADCIVVPNIPEKLGHWENLYEGDYRFAMETCRLWGQVEFCPDLISLARPQPEECWW